MQAHLKSLKFETKLLIACIAAGFAVAGYHGTRLLHSHNDVLINKKKRDVTEKDGILFIPRDDSLQRKASLITNGNRNEMLQ